MAEIEIDGKKLEAEDGKMIIEVADEAGITIPRYCYHRKLSIAANCRMCLVEVEKAPKPLPACATPIMPGMKIFTQSPTAIAAQRSVMEFLLINHPLDCPICDQGGQCELQDLAMGYGSGLSEYEEGKRSVKNKNIGPLIATEMTRCIHCTRCVRFGEEVAGLRELGATFRGEKMEIGTYVEHALRSEVSGNIIDLCPVGALLSKPFLFRGRAWELIQHPSISPHDCLGTNTYIHTRNSELMRIVPRENDAINETWISDRDRFSYLGFKSADRIKKPMIKHHGQLQETDWQTALRYVTDALNNIIEQNGADEIAALASPNGTIEEFYLFQKWLRGIGCNNIDHRLHQLDFSDQEQAPVAPGMDINIDEIENRDRILLIGSNIQREQPLLGLRVRKASLNGAKVTCINPVDYAFNFTLSDKVIVSPTQMIEALAGVAKALVNHKEKLPSYAEQLLSGITPTEQQIDIAKEFKSGEKQAIFLGALALNHPQAGLLKQYALLIARLTDASFAYLTEGGNTAGAYLMGVLPHRELGAQKVKTPGLHTQDILKKNKKALVLFNVEPEFDCADSAQALKAVQAADFIVSISPYCGGLLREHADVVLPITPYSENIGTYINVTGAWQRSKPAIQSYEESRPAWKIFRVLGNLFRLDGFLFDHNKEVTEEIKTNLKNLNLEHSMINQDTGWATLKKSSDEKKGLSQITEWSIYGMDNILRRSKPLQDSLAYEAIGARIHPDTAKNLKVVDDDKVLIKQHVSSITLPVIIDKRIPKQCVHVVAGIEQTCGLGKPFANVEIVKV